MPHLPEFVPDLLPGLCFLLDERLRLLGWNRNVEALLGLKEDALAGADAIGFVAPPDRALARATAHESLACGRSECEIDVVGGDGEERRFLMTSYGIDAAGGRQVLGIGVDVTERRRSEAALRLSEARFRNAFDSAGHGMSWAGLDGRFLRVNPAYCRMTGYSAGELLAMKVADLIPAEDLDRARQERRRLEAGESESFQLELRHRRRDGQTIWVRLDVGLVRDDAGRPLHFTAQVEDVTARRAAEATSRAYAERLGRALQQTLSSLSRLLERLDPYTVGHERRTAALADAIAHDLGLDGEARSVLAMAADVHDIGKIAVPPAILARPGRLSPEEYALVKTHVQVGYEILKDIELPWPIAAIVLQHHERLDGSGYPEGLSGDAIGREARILAVADVVEAMSSHRPYRPALGIEAALAQIRQDRGCKLDPAVVDVCVALFGSGRFAFSPEG